MLGKLREEKRAVILHLAELHGCRNVRVFGSIATGDNRADSDVDFLVDLDGGRNLFELGGLLADRKDALASDVDLGGGAVSAPPHSQSRSSRG